MQSIRDRQVVSSDSLASFPTSNNLIYLSFEFPVAQTSSIHPFAQSIHPSIHQICLSMHVPFLHKTSPPKSSQTPRFTRLFSPTIHRSSSIVHRSSYIMHPSLLRHFIRIVASPPCVPSSCVVLRILIPPLERLVLMLSGVGCLPSYTTCPWLASDESTCNTDDHEDVRAVDSRRHVTSRHPSMGCRVSKNQPTNQFRGCVFAITHISPLSVPSSTTNNRVVDVPPYPSPQLAERYSLLLIRLLPPRAPVPSTGD